VCGLDIVFLEGEGEKKKEGGGEKGGGGGGGGGGRIDGA